MYKLLHCHRFSAKLTTGQHLCLLLVLGCLFGLLISFSPASQSKDLTHLMAQPGTEGVNPQLVGSEYQQSGRRPWLPLQPQYSPQEWRKMMNDAGVKPAKTKETCQRRETTTPGGPYPSPWWIL